MRDESPPDHVELVVFRMLALGSDILCEYSVHAIRT